MLFILCLQSDLVTGWTVVRMPGVDASIAAGYHGESSVWNSPRLSLYLPHI